MRKYSRDVMLPRVGGNVPVNLLVVKQKAFSPAKLLPALDGNDPTNALFWTWKLYNLLIVHKV
jgi:hypothetical protein